MKLKGFAAALLAAIFYGTNPLGTLQLYADGMNPSSVLVYRYAFATLMFLIWMVAKRESLTISLGTAIRLAILGTLMSMSSATLYLSFRYMDAGVASTILFSYPIMVAVLMVVFYHEHMTWSTTLCILMAVSGIALLYHGKGGVTLSTVGVTLVILSSLLYAFYIIGVNQTHTKLSPVKFTFWIVFFGLLALLVYTLFIGEPLEPLRTPLEWASALQLALLPTVLSLYFINIAIEHIGSTPTAIMGAVEPVTAVCIGVCIFG
ncbi:MAG: EamA family transporter, partial [Prevotella sp.]|nr:EamA family transporter [Prevotella sp.]